MIKKAPNKYTVIRITTETHKKLIQLGIKGETFDEIINRMIENGKDE